MKMLRIHLMVFTTLVANCGTTTIKAAIDYDKIYDDVAFWAAQMAEHAEFAAGFTNDAALKQKGNELSAHFKKYTKGSMNPAAIKEFLKASDDILRYQNEVRSFLKRQKGDHQLSLDLLDHMDKETAYAKKKAHGKRLSKREEAQFWSEEHEGEAHVISALMTPKAPALKQEAQALEKKLKDNAHFWKDSLKVVENANDELDKIGAELEKDPSKTKVPAKLAQHEKRERARAAQTFRELEAQR